jgi:glycolate oxidase iron-sulfur subunit
MDDLSATDRCVKCGLCLPHCPTFTLTGNEADSPRGRISLMQWLDDAPEISPGLLTHIDRCLQCGACEAICPSKVPFRTLMDSARARLVPRHHRGFIDRILARAGTKLLSSPRALRLAGPLLNGYYWLGLPAVLGKLPGTPGRLNRLLAGMAETKTSTEMPRKTFAIHEQHIPRVHLFPGCTGHTLDRQTLHDTRNLLRALGYEAAISRNTACCGSIHQHNGHPEIAASLASHNFAELNDSNAPVISIASGCAAHLQNHDSLSPRVNEIMEFLAGQDSAALHFDPCEQPVGVHVPCTQRNALHQSQAIFDVLSWIPGLETRHINPQGGCCGAAGSYMITQPELSDALGNVMAEQVAESGVRTLLTNNIGCSIQFQAQLHAKGLTVDVIHPVTLLWRQLNK